MTADDQAALVRDLAMLVRCALARPAEDRMAGEQHALASLTRVLGTDDGAGLPDLRLRIALGMAPAVPLNRSGNVRGFTTYDKFTDTYGSSVRVHQSSAAAGPHCWIFCTAGHPADQATAPHLDVAQARRVRHALGAFIAEHGEPL
jgi:hypothetical protein